MANGGVEIVMPKLKLSKYKGAGMNNIKKVIWDSGLRKGYIAEQMGIVPSNISNWISGERKPSKSNIITRIINYLILIFIFLICLTNCVAK